MATLGKGTLYLNSAGGKTYKFNTGDYSVTDLVSAPQVVDVIADNKPGESQYIASIKYQNTHYLQYYNTNEFPNGYNLLNRTINFEIPADISVTLGYSTSLYMDRTNSTDGQVIGDLLYNILKAFERISPSAFTSTVRDSYGNTINYIFYTQVEIGVTFATSAIVNAILNDEIECSERYEKDSTSIYLIPVKSGVYKINVITDVLKTNIEVAGTFNISRVPEKPVWLGPYYDESGKYWTIKTKSRRKGNIYFNGSPEPLQSWTDDTTGPWSYKFYPQQAGAYTANTISTVNLGGARDIYSELSETLIVENEVVDIQISFNEYTGTLTATAPEGSYFVYKLMKKAGEGYGQVGENTTGIFQITESGTYRVECDAKPLFVVNPSQPITVETALDTPNAYVEFSNPSQLGFDEVENANVYDIYRVSDDGEKDELVESVTVGVAARARSVKRAEKIFRVVVEDDGYSL